MRAGLPRYLCYCVTYVTPIAWGCVELEGEVGAGGGYGRLMVVEAGSLEEALRIAKRCPERGTGGVRIVEKQ